MMTNLERDSQGRGLELKKINQLNSLREILNKNYLPDQVIKQIPKKISDSYPAVLGMNSNSGEFVFFPLSSDNPRSILLPGGQDGLPVIKMFLESIARFSPIIYYVSPDNKYSNREISRISPTNYLPYERNFQQEISELARIMEQRKYGRELGSPYILIMEDFSTIYGKFIQTGDFGVKTNFENLVNKANRGFALLALVKNPAYLELDYRERPLQINKIIPLFQAKVIPVDSSDQNGFRQYDLQRTHGPSIPLLVPQS